MKSAVKEVSSAPLIQVLGKEVMLMCAGALFIALCAQVRVPLGFTPVPVTLQTFAVLLLGMLLGSRQGVQATCFYLCLAAFGFPVLSGGSSGLVHLFGCTAGYIAGFVVEAFLAGFAKNRRGVLIFGFLAASSLVQLLLGTLWLGTYVGFSSAFSMGFWPFLLGDLMKVGTVYQIASWVQASGDSADSRAL